MSYLLSDKLRRCRVGNRTAKDVLRCLCDHADDDGFNCYPSRQTIMSETEIGINYIAPALKFLEENGWISISKHQKGNSNSYVINVAKLQDGSKENESKRVVTKECQHQMVSTPNGDDSSHQMVMRVVTKGLHDSINTLSILNHSICPQTQESADDSKLQKQIPCPQQKLIELYHEKLPTLPVVRSWNSPARIQSMRSRWRFVMSEKKYTTEAEGLEWFSKFFDFCNRSLFLRGEGSPNRATGRAFVPDLEWILKPSNFDKIIDGRYHQ